MSPESNLDNGPQQQQPLEKIIAIAYLNNRGPENLQRVAKSWGVRVRLNKKTLEIEWENFEKDQELIDAVYSFLTETAEATDSEFRTAMQTTLKQILKDLQIPICDRLLKAESRTQKGTLLIEHIFRVLYLTQTDHLIDTTHAAIDADEKKRTRILYRMTSAFHDIIGKPLITEQEDGKVYVGDDRTQDHAAMSAWAMHARLKTQELCNPCDLKLATSAITNHHIFEICDQNKMSTAMAVETVRGGRSYELLTGLALADVTSVKGYEKFIVGNVIQMINIATLMYGSFPDSGLREYFSFISNQLQALIEHVNRYPEHFNQQESIFYLQKSQDLVLDIKGATLNL